MRQVPWWAVLSASMAPVFLIGGWTLAGARQPAGYSGLRDTISALAGLGATDRWVMTLGLAGLGACHMVTALGLHPAAGPGRLLLATGGAATVAVALFPVPRVGTSGIHAVFAGVGFVALALWPVLAIQRGEAAPTVLRPVASIVATVVLLGFLGWFATVFFGEGTWIGLTERVLAGAQAFWPLAVVLAIYSASATRSSAGM